MRKLLALLLTTLLLLPIQASAASDTLWDDARAGVDGGTIGGISINLSNSTTQETISTELRNLPSIVEVYTATWCFNCIDSEHALDEAIGDTDVTRIHYHRHKFETLDPFGSNSTESRWEAEYGEASVMASRTGTSGGLERLAPSSVFDGERFYLGTKTKSNSLLTDYSTSLSLGSSHPFENTENSSLSFGVEKSESGFNISWSNSLSASVDWSAEAVLLFVEQNAHYPDGSNGVEYYKHVLHEAVSLPQWQEGSIDLTPPAPWEGDDMSVVLIIDWETPTQDKSSPLPAPAVSTLLCFLAAFVPGRKGDSAL
tara:strand:+ start:310 stop:1248 length:939 start_codon:yes stop_codon:yes gene_type:complete